MMKNTLQSTRKLLHDGIISIVLTKHIIDKEGRCHPQQKYSCLLTKTPPNMPCIFFCVKGCTALPNHPTLLQKY
jgi:hypothetical protein